MPPSVRLWKDGRQSNSKHPQPQHLTLKIMRAKAASLLPPLLSSPLTLGLHPRAHVQVKEDGPRSTGCYQQALVSPVLSSNKPDRLANRTHAIKLKKKAKHVNDVNREQLPRQEARLSQLAGSAAGGGAFQAPGGSWKLIQLRNVGFRGIALPLATRQRGPDQTTSASKVNSVFLRGCSHRRDQD